MAHFAQLDENNIVVQVIVVSNNDCLDENGNESEAKGIAFCKMLLGEHTRWVQTSYNSNFRGRYAGLGYLYDASKDIFIPPKPHASWIWDDTLPVNGDWKAPKPYPEVTEDNYKIYLWNEELVDWVEFIPQE